MVDLNPLILIISLKVGILNISLKGRDNHTAWNSRVYRFLKDSMYA